MTNDKHRRVRKNLRELEEFKLFQQALHEGFVIESQERALTNPALLDCSQPLAKVLLQGTGFRRREETLHQFRQFFNEVRALKKRSGHPIELGVALRMLRARMGYAAGRRTISEDLSLVINECIDRMLEAEGLDRQLPGFCDLFESLYAYYYYHAKSRQGGS